MRQRKRPNSREGAVEKETERQVLGSTGPFGERWVSGSSETLLVEVFREMLEIRGHGLDHWKHGFQVSTWAKRGHAENLDGLSLTHLC